jgi:hypothetical protein
MAERGNPERGKAELEMSEQRAVASRRVLDSADRVLSDIRALSATEDKWATLVRDAFRGN